ncbi:MAG: oligosaccharide flippase family protein [Clostridia bacterium]|nr:oligosaccharide flippase family protein [Clostridia bacterium]
MPRTSLLKSIATVTGFSVLTRTLAFLFKIYLSRTLGAESLGLYQTAITVFFLFIAFSTGGISTVLSRKIAESNATEGGDKGLKLLSASLTLGLGASLICLIVAYLILPHATFLIPDKRAIPILKIMLPALVSTTFYIIIRGWFWGNKLFLDFSLSEFMEEILRIILTFLFVSGIISSMSGETGVALAFLISDILVMALIIFTFLKRGGKFIGVGSFKDVLKPATPLTIMKIFGSLVGVAVTLIVPTALIASGMTTADATASVGRVSGMANPLLFAPNALISSLAIVLIPEMSESNAKSDMESLRKQISSGITASLVVSGGFMVVYLALGRELTAFLYNDIPSGVYLEKASVLLLLSPINHILASSMNSVGKEKENFLTYLVGGTLMLISSVITPKYLGLDGIIVSELLFTLVVVIGNSYFLRKQVKHSLGIPKSLLSVTILALSCSIIAHLLNELTARINDVFALIFSSVFAFALYFAVAYLLGIFDLKALLKRKKSTAL